MKLPTIGYHITYLSRWNSIKKHGLLINMPRKLCTGIDTNLGIYFIIHPRLANWSARDRNLDRNKDWIIIQASQLQSQHIIADPDFGCSPRESIKYGGTFAYNVSISPSQLSIFAIAKGTKKYKHDEFESLK